MGFNSAFKGLSDRSLLSELNTFVWHMLKSNFVYPYKKRMAFSVPVFTKFTVFNGPIYRRVVGNFTQIGQEVGKLGKENHFCC